MDYVNFIKWHCAHCPKGNLDSKGALGDHCISAHKCTKNFKCMKCNNLFSSKSEKDMHEEEGHWGQLPTKFIKLYFNPKITNLPPNVQDNMLRFNYMDPLSESSEGSQTKEEGDSEVNDETEEEVGNDNEADGGVEEGGNAEEVVEEEGNAEEAVEEGENSEEDESEESGDESEESGDESKKLGNESDESDGVKEEGDSNYDSDSDSNSGSGSGSDSE